MKKYIYLSLLILALLGWFFKISSSGVKAEADAKVLNIYVDGEKRVIASQSNTVGEALESSGIVLYPHDKSEPSVDAQITSNEFNVTIYRARPITVIDGPNTYTITTAERTPRAIAVSAGFKPREEDGFKYENSDSPFDGSPGTLLYIKRSKQVTLELYGTASKLRTQEITVEDLLKDKGINLEKGDELNLPLPTRITEGMKISISQINKKVKTIEEPIPFLEEQIQDANQPVTYKKIQTKGKNGRKLVTYEITTKNGKIFKKRALKAVVTEKSSKQVVIVGTKLFSGDVSAEKQSILKKAGISADQWDSVDYIISRESGWRPGALNAGGCAGLGQACPGSKLAAVCPSWQSDPVCQIKFFTGYANGRYGSWNGAAAAWVRQGWW
jgi:uncharacterized protein YabE (DUF348 family)